MESKHAAELASASARAKTLEDEYKKLKDKLDQGASQARRLEDAKTKKAAEVTSLKRQLEMNKAFKRPT